MDLKIKTNSSLDYFNKLVHVLSLVSPMNSLRKQELTLLAFFLYYNNKYKDLDVEDRKAIIMDNKGTRIDISEKMGIGDQTFYNLKARLKLKGLLKDGYLSKNFISLYERDLFNINFIFNK